MRMCALSHRRKKADRVCGVCVSNCHLHEKEIGARATINFYSKSTQRKRKWFAVATKPKQMWGEWAMDGVCVCVCATDQQNGRHETKKKNNWRREQNKNNKNKNGKRMCWFFAWNEILAAAPIHQSLNILQLIIKRYVTASFHCVWREWICLSAAICKWNRIFTFLFDVAALKRIC